MSSPALLTSRSPLFLKQIFSGMDPCLGWALASQLTVDDPMSDVEFPVASHHEKIGCFWTEYYGTKRERSP